jgi:hypothetical protein
MHNCPYLGDLLFRLPRFSQHPFTEESGASEREKNRKMRFAALSHSPVFLIAILETSSITTYVLSV